ncbi:hypothetical protein FIV32_02400 [Sphingomonadales bacterium 58]|uniref:hypothetical protein n=1 Tax=Sphingobium sp. S8 TaxID=2758385 RepID=UPI001918B764|nr:hypothetical protein [Sphingobium sp. S8]MBY2957600.1 hypothetical protein [Sphingomonadales bacterium 58]CAD7335413.1 hypothetical protein SPHS8_00495 [Sphingobium sp. S8]
MISPYGRDLVCQRPIVGRDDRRQTTLTPAQEDVERSGSFSALQVSIRYRTLIAPMIEVPDDTRNRRDRQQVRPDA